MTEYFGGKRVQSARQRTATASAKDPVQKKLNDSVYFDGKGEKHTLLQFFYFYDDVIIKFALGFTLD